MGLCRSCEPSAAPHPAFSAKLALLWPKALLHRALLVHVSLGPPLPLPGSRGHLLSPLTVPRAQRGRCLASCRCLLPAGPFPDSSLVLIPSRYTRRRTGAGTGLARRGGSRAVLHQLSSPHSCQLPYLFEPHVTLLRPSQSLSIMTQSPQASSHLTCWYLALSLPGTSLFTFHTLLTQSTWVPGPSLRAPLGTASIACCLLSAQFAAVGGKTTPTAVLAKAEIQQEENVLFPCPPQWMLIWAGVHATLFSEHWGCVKHSQRCWDGGHTGCCCPGTVTGRNQVSS